MFHQVQPLHILLKVNSIFHGYLVYWVFNPRPRLDLHNIFLELWTNKFLHLHLLLNKTLDLKPVITCMEVYHHLQPGGYVFTLVSLVLFVLKDYIKTTEPIFTTLVGWKSVCRGWIHHILRPPPVLFYISTQKLETILCGTVPLCRGTVCPL